MRFCKRVVFLCSLLWGLSSFGCITTLSLRVARLLQLRGAEMLAKTCLGKSINVGFDIKETPSEPRFFAQLDIEGDSYFYEFQDVKDASTIIEEGVNNGGKSISWYCLKRDC